MKTKKNSGTKPAVALQSQATWVTQQLDRASWKQVSNTARTIIEALSKEEIRALPSDVRQRLLRYLKTGRITEADRNAVDKLTSAELVELEYQRRLVIKGSAEFVETTTKHLSKLASLTIGRRLLSSLHRSGKKITIIPTNRVSEAPPDDFKSAIAKGKVLKWKDVNGSEKRISGTGKGSNTTIRYNPALTCSCQTVDWRKHPPEIALAHELIHADDAAYGRLDPDETDGVRNYERQAVGLYPYERKGFTENKFRASWHDPLPPRLQY
ncbi:MAG: M91 family zinc metallopeptidase [Blastocatellales bacterium]